MGNWSAVTYANKDPKNKLENMNQTREQVESRG